VLILKEGGSVSKDSGMSLNDVNGSSHGGGGGLGGGRKKLMGMFKGKNPAQVRPSRVSLLFFEIKGRVTLGCVGCRCNDKKTTSAIECPSPLTLSGKLSSKRSPPDKSTSTPSYPRSCVCVAPSSPVLPIKSALTFASASCIRRSC
jgi:hypothetical protein